MKILFLVIGKTDESYLETGISKFIKRLEHYIPFEMKIIPDIKNRKTLNEEQQKKIEGDLILSQITPGDDLVLLDENGKTFSSVSFSQWIEKQMNTSTKRIVFVVGGPYGFSENVYQRANAKISLSKMTFSHQMVRLFFVEQIYRAMTILRSEPYHHE
jgi:23S rRNA (pseudouridine1915-N3)-methyltransferase